MSMILKETSSSLFRTYHISTNDKKGAWFEVDDFGGSLSLKIKNELTGDKAETYYYLEFPFDGEFCQNLLATFSEIGKNNSCQHSDSNEVSK